ncbi:MAG: hypothetical protein ACJA0Y_000083, partial [Maricaulis maris]
MPCLRLIVIGSDIIGCDIIDFGPFDRRVDGRDRRDSIIDNSRIRPDWVFGSLLIRRGYTTIGPDPDEIDRRLVGIEP